jgi:hypothetical protein
MRKKMTAVQKAQFGRKLVAARRAKNIDTRTREWAKVIAEQTKPKGESK